MTFNSPAASHRPSQKSSALIQKLQKLSANDLSKLYKIKPEAAQKEARRWQELAAGQAAAYPALQLLNGLMYRNIRRDLSTEEEAFVRQHVFITSALYGVISALEPIAAHRLDFNMPFKINGQSLKAYWRKDFDAFVSPDDTVVSLLSSEFEDVFSTSVRQNFISLKFMEEKAGQLKTHSTISKKARGQFLSQIITDSLQTVDALKTLEVAGFSYQDSLSGTNQLVFVKNA